MVSVYLPGFSRIKAQSIDEVDFLKETLPHAKLFPSQDLCFLKKLTFEKLVQVNPKLSKLIAVEQLLIDEEREATKFCP